MNFPLIIMVFLAIALLTLLILLNYRGMNSWVSVRQNVVIQNTSLCELPLDQLVQIDIQEDICCINNGKTTGAYYIEKPVDDTTDILKMSVIPSPTYYVNVCREYCTAGYTVNSDGTLLCIGDTSPTDFQTNKANNCVDAIRPQFSDGTTCRGSAMPIAALGTTPMYGFHIDTSTGFAQCETRGPCV
jgi:hypothetical protein